MAVYPLTTVCRSSVLWLAVYRAVAALLVGFPLLFDYSGRRLSRKIPLV